MKAQQRIVITPQDIDDAFESMMLLEQHGLEIPVILEHTEPAEHQVEGVPMTLSALRADELRRTVGRIKCSSPHTRINDAGAIEADIEILDADIARKIEQGLIKFVSPEVRREWTDGKGNAYKSVITHVALTHRPVQIDQRGFMLASDQKNNHQCVRLSDLDEPAHLELESDMPEPTTEKPAQDAENTAQDAENAQLVELAKRLGDMGVDVPAEPTTEKLLAALLDWLREQDSEPEPEPTPDNAQLVEGSQPVTFSCDADPREPLRQRVTRCVARGQLPREAADALLVRLGTAQFSDAGVEVCTSGLSVADVIEICEARATPNCEQHRDAVTRRVKALSSAGKITPAVRDRLLLRVGALQFSEAGDELVSDGMAMTDVLDALEANQDISVLTVDATANYQLSSMSEAQHPDKKYMNGSHTYEGAQAKELASALLQRVTRPNK